MAQNGENGSGLEENFVVSVHNSLFPHTNSDSPQIGAHANKILVGPNPNSPIS